MAKRNAKPRSTSVEVSVPQGDGRPPWMRVGVLSAAGLALGMAWPTLAGIRIGPNVPGANKPDLEAVVEQTAPPPLAASASATPSADSTVVEGDPASPRNNQQKVVVGAGTIERCFQGKDALKGEACGTLPIDKVLVPRLEALNRCSAAVGLAGEMTVGFDIDFTKKDIHVLKGKSELPLSTVQGVIVCIADYIRDVSADKIGHKYTKYRVFYSLKFFPPGTAPPTEGTQEADTEDADAARAMATVTWDTALVRSEPKTGDVVMRLVRGTRVKILSRRKDWYRIRMREKEGWIYRGALGR